MIAGIWTDPMVIFGSAALVASILLARWAMEHPEMSDHRCEYCGQPISQDGGAWVSEDGDWACEDNHGDLGPHRPEILGQPSASQSAG